MITENASTMRGMRDVAGRCTRREFLGLLAAGCVAGSLVGCASTSAARTASTASTAPATPLAPASRITPENAAQITQLALLQPVDGRVRGVTWSPDGQLVATGSNQYVRLWDAATGHNLATLSGHSDQIFSLAWSPVNKLLASASFDGTVRLWDVQLRRTLQTLDSASASSIFSITWAPDGQQLACGTLNGSVLLWDVQTGKQIATWNGPPERESQGGRYPFAAWGVSWSPDGRHIVSTRYDDLVLIWDVATGKALVIPKTDTQPNTVAWAPNGSQFALTDDQGKVILWNGASYQRSATFGGQDAAGWAYGLAWSPDSSMVASSRETGIVQVWEAQTGKALATLQGGSDASWGLAWSLDGLRLASASDDGTVCLWGIAKKS